MYHFISLCNIPILSSFKPKHRFTSNFLWMFPGRAPAKFVQIGVLPLFYGIMGNFEQFLVNSY